MIRDRGMSQWHFPVGTFRGRTIPRSDIPRSVHFPVDREMYRPGNVRPRNVMIWEPHIATYNHREQYWISQNQTAQNHTQFIRQGGVRGWLIPNYLKLACHTIDLAGAKLPYLINLTYTGPVHGPNLDRYGGPVRYVDRYFLVRSASLVCIGVHFFRVFFQAPGGNEAPPDQTLVGYLLSFVWSATCWPDS